MKPILLRKDDAPRFDVHGASITGYASPSRGSAALAAWRVELAPGTASPLHSLEVDEVFVVLRGAAEFQVSGEAFRAAAGDGVTVPAGTEFRIAAVGDQPFEAVACVPAGCRARVAGGEPFVPPWAC